MRIELNLVPAAVQQRREGVSRRRVLVAVAVLPVVGVAALYAVVVIDARQAQEASRDYDARLTAVRPVAIEVSLLEGEIADLEQRQQRLRALVGHLDESPFLDLLRVVGLQEGERERTITQFRMTARLRSTP